MTFLAKPVTWLAGYIPDLPTPFDESGAIDLSALESLCERQIKAGVSAIVVDETTGEASTLTPDEHEVHYAMVVVLAMGIGLFAPRSGPRAAGSASLPAPGRIRPARPSN